MGTTAAPWLLPYPEQADPADVPTDIHELGTAVHTALDALQSRIAALESGAGSFVQLRDLIATASQLSFDFTAIPGTYAHLLLLLHARSDGAGAAGLVNVRANGDAGSNYDAQFTIGSAGAASASETVAGTNMALFQVPGGGAPAGVFGGGIATFPGYASAAGQKVGTGNNALKQTNATGGMTERLSTGFWRNTVAINQLTVIPANGNWFAGSRATLYGLR